VNNAIVHQIAGNGPGPTTAVTPPTLHEIQAWIGAGSRDPGMSEDARLFGAVWPERAVSMKFEIARHLV